MDLKNKKMFIYTDGVTEGYIDGEQEFTIKGSRKRNFRKTIVLILKRLLMLSLIRLNNRENLRDDITMMGIQ